MNTFLTKCQATNLMRVYRKVADGNLTCKLGFRDNAATERRKLDNQFCVIIRQALNICAWPVRSQVAHITNDLRAA